MFEDVLRCFTFLPVGEHRLADGGHEAQALQRLVDVFDAFEVDALNALRAEDVVDVRGPLAVAKAIDPMAVPRAARRVQGFQGLHDTDSRTHNGA